MEQSNTFHRIEPPRSGVHLNLSELWQYRELLYFLVWRDIKVRYKQTLLGAGWAILQPVMTMLVFSLFFGKLAKIPSDNIPYPIFCFAALVPWNFFANGLTQSSNSLVGSSNLITKVYFPRLAIPLASILSGAVDFMLSFLVLLLLIIYYAPPLSINLLLLPCFILTAFITALGAGLWLSALNVQFRDVRYLIPFITQFWMLATPVAYSGRMLPEPWRSIYGINPMAGVVEGFRWSLLGIGSSPGPIIIVSIITSLLLLLSGLIYFQKMEKTFADIV